MRLLKLLAVLALAAFPVLAQQQQFPSGVVQPNLNAWYFSPNCSGQTNCTTIHADAVILTDCTTVNTSSTITCPDAIFNSSDVGKTAWAQTQGNGLAATLVQINGLLVCPTSTISLVNSSTSITLAAANDCTSGLSGTAVLVFGTKDGATISSAMAATAANFVFTGGSSRIANAQPRILVEQGFGNTLASSPNAPFITMSGSTPSTSSALFIITPDFNWAGCTGNNGVLSNVCFAAKAINVSYLSWVGMGLNGTGACTSAANKTVVGPNSLVSQNYAMNLNGICPGTAGLEGYELDSYDSTVTFGGAVHVGQFSCAVGGNAQSVSGFYNDCINDGATVTGNGCASGIGVCAGLWVKAGAQYQDVGSEFIEKGLFQGTVITHGAHYYSPGGGQSALIVSGAGASWISDSDFINGPETPASGSAAGVNLDLGGVMYARNTKWTVFGTSPAVQLSNDGAATFFYDEGGNKWSGAGTVNYTNLAVGTNQVIGTSSAEIANLVTGNIGLTSGWGTSSVASVVNGSDSHQGRFTITGAAGAAGPTLTLTFPTAYPLIAPASCHLSFESAGAFTDFTSVTAGTPTLTNVLFTFVGTPTAVTLIFSYQCGP